MTTYDGEVLADSPLAFWRLQEAAGVTVMNDFSGNARNGAFTAGGPTLGVAGIVTGDAGTCADFSGVSGKYGSCNDAAWMDVTNLTVEAVIKPDFVSGTAYSIIDRDYTAGGFDRVFQFRIASSKLSALVWNASTFAVATGATTLVAGTTYHVAMTYDGATIRLYVNGVLDGSTALAGPMKTGVSPLVVGANSSGSVLGGAANFDGKLQKAAVYGTALSAPRLLVHATRASAGPTVDLALTATVNDEVRGVDLLIPGGTPPYVVTAHPSGSPAYVVRSPFGSVAGGSPDARVAVDGDVPLGVPVYYTVVDDNGDDATSGTVTVESASSVLADALDPYRVLDVEVVTQLPNRWEGRSVWWDILGAAAPFPSIAPMRLRNGPLRLRTAGRAARLALIALLAPGRPLVLRTPFPDTVDDVVLLVESADEAPVLDEDQAGTHEWTLGYQAVSRDPLGSYAVEPGRTYDDLNAEALTYDALDALHATYDLLRAGS